MNQKNLKILHIVPTLGKGGGARVVIDLVNFAVQQGNTVELLIVEDSPIQNIGVLDLIDKKVDISFALDNNVDTQHNSTFGGTLKKAYKWLLFVTWILKNRKKISIHNIVHVHMPIAIVGGNVIKFLSYWYNWNTKIYETVHSDTKSLKYSTFTLFKESWRFRDGVIFEIRKEDMLIFKNFYPNIPVKFIPLGVHRISRKNHESNRYKLRKELNIAEETIVIGQIGRLNIQDRRTNMYPILFKEIDDIIANNTQKIQFILFGDGLDRIKVENQIYKLKLSERVKIYGYVDNLEEAFSIIDFYVTLNIREDCGIAGLQAISYGIPTVAIQGDPTYTIGEDDWIPNSLNMNKLSKIIVENMSNRNVLAEKQAQFFSLNISADKMSKETLDFYNEVV